MSANDPKQTVRIAQQASTRPSNAVQCLVRDGAMKKNKNARWPISRVLYLRAGDDHSSGTSVTGRLARPTRMTVWKRTCDKRVSSLFGLAPGEVYHAVSVTSDAVRSYRTLSPLPDFHMTPGGLLSVALSRGSPPPDVIRHRVSMEPGLSSPQSRNLERRPSGHLATL